MHKQGFTFIELLTALAIIGILAGIVFANIREAKESARIATAEQNVDAIAKSIKLLENDTGEWPGHKTIDDVESGASGNEIWDLSVQSAGIMDTDGAYVGWNGPYMQSMPLDPWGNNYFFDTDYDVDSGPGETWAAVVGSFGPNGDAQNVYDADNIFKIITTE